MLADGDGLWLSSHVGLFHYQPPSPAEKVPIPPLGEKPALDGVFRGPAGRLHVLSSRGILRQEAGGWTRLGEKPTGATAFDTKGRLWTTHGDKDMLGCIDGGAPVWRDLRKTPLAHLYFTGIAAEESGGLWFATLDDGVACAHPMRFSTSSREGATTLA